LQTVTGQEYCELAYISQVDSGHIYLVSDGGTTQEIPAAGLGQIAPNPVLLYDLINGGSPGEVSVTQIVDLAAPFPTPDNSNNMLSRHVIRLVTPYRSPDGAQVGFYMLSIPASSLRNILSLYNSPRSPIWAYARTNEVRYCFFFDTEGWILFQSEGVTEPEAHLSTYLARAGLTGTLGKPGMPDAFRPASGIQTYWKMFDDVRQGQFDLLVASDVTRQSEVLRDYYLAYGPVHFFPGGGKPPVIYGGVASVDRSLLGVTAGYKHVDIMFLVTVGTVLLVSAIIVVLSRIFTKPILQLTRAVNRMRAKGELEPLVLRFGSFETVTLKNAINDLMTTLRRQVEVIHSKDMEIESASLKERAVLSAGRAGGPNGGPDPLPEIKGEGPQTERLKADILKAAHVDVDVLIEGETGTGKQLTAEAIHNRSSRKRGTFISINCGALDETLLLDTLFGHVKGAYTEARTDREGAFLAANGGTLFLDEIQVASPRVQQSLLRAIEVRKIKPLGSDKELDVDVRLIAATNIDLKVLIDRGLFRGDLYFRLKVITLHTPSLRDQPENLPLLAMHFLSEAEKLAGRTGMGISRGALEALKAYHWPGNMRELKNVITRAVVMCESDLIQAEDIVLEEKRHGAIPGEGIPAPALPAGLGFPTPPGPAASGPAASRPVPPRPAVPRRTGSAPMAPRSGSAQDAAAHGPVAPAPAASAPAASAPAASAPAASGPAASGPAASGPVASGPMGHAAPAAHNHAAIPAPPPDPADPLDALNPRQAKALQEIMARGGVTRKQYQQIIGDDLPPRTANYDLQDLVAKGLLRKSGKGPATRYHVAEAHNGRPQDDRNDRSQA
ncbi:MAG: sigma 54-interacting transcriptional regulator, partial [Desulfovibrionaceae bacterium]